MRRRTTAAIAAGLLVAGLASGCSVPRAGNPMGSDIAGCAAVLPPARDAVHGHGRLVLIHALGRKDEDAIDRDLGSPPPPPPPPRPAPAPQAAGAATPKTCVVVYEGDYPAGSVTGAPADSAGRYAIVVARVRHPVVDRVLLVDQLPKSLPGR